MAGQSNAAVVVIKRKKVIQAAGHHGGAWKVAYADFVTAMMAFFLLMWLLNATTEKQRKGLADYFNPTVSVSRISGGGDGSFGGDSVMSEQTLAQSGIGATSERPTEADKARGDTGTAEAEDRAMEDIRRQIDSRLSARGGESMTMERMLRHVVTRVTDQGLVIELFDLDNSPLFDPETDRPTRTTQDLATMLVEVISLSTNGISVEGHVRNYPITLRDSPVWRLSSGRAQAMRTLLQTAGLRPDRFQRITGHADRTPVTANPTVPRNNRIEIILLRKDT